MSNINTSLPPSEYKFPKNTVLEVGDDGKICAKQPLRGNADDFFSTVCFDPFPGMKIIFQDDDTPIEPPEKLGGQKPVDKDDPAKQPSTQQLMNSLIQMLQQLIVQIQGNTAVGGKA